MKHLSLLLLGSIILSLLFFTGFLTLWPNQGPPQPAVIVSVQQELTPLEARLAQQEADYLAQLKELDQTLQTQQTAYEARTKSLNDQIIAAQDQLNNLQRRRKELQSELTLLQRTRIQQTTTYQAQLQQAQVQHDHRLPQLQTQLKETQDKLSQVDLQLGSQ